MAIKVSYVVKESVGNLRRNLLMTAAALITVTISLALAGASLLFRNGIDNAYIQFKNGFDITVMMKADASQEQIDGIGTELRSNPQIDQKAKKPRFVTKEESYEEIQRMFQNAPETLSAFRGVEDAPAQWRFKPVDAEQLEVLGQRFQKRAGVLSVFLCQVSEVDSLGGATYSAHCALYCCCVAAFRGNPDFEHRTYGYFCSAT
jgi:cell division transport system permease protein